MHFTTLSLALLGLAAFASAVPHQLEHRDQSLTWTPRALQERRPSDNDNDAGSVAATDSTAAASSQKKNSELQLAGFVQNSMQSNSMKNKLKDTLRKNSYQNKNPNVNTVIIVITAIIDIRDPSNQNTRYLKHKLLADNKKKQDVTIQVTEFLTLTISGNDNSVNSGQNLSGGTAATAASNGLAAAGVQTADPSAPYPSASGAVMLPSGASAPSALNTERDPAGIIEEGYVNGFVQLSVHN